MKILACILIIGLMISMNVLAACASEQDDDASPDEGGSSVLGSTVLGGLLGGGLGTAIGSISGNAGKGALIGAGVGAVGGALVGANKDDQNKGQRLHRDRAQYRQERSEEDQYLQEPAQVNSQAVPKGAQIKKKVVRQYDASGNVVSEKEVPAN